MSAGEAQQAAAVQLAHKHTWLFRIPFINQHEDVAKVAQQVAELNPGEFNWAVSLDPEFIAELMFHGFITMCERLDSETVVLLPKLHTSRSVLVLKDFHISKSTRKKAKQFHLSLDQAFDRVCQGIVAQHGPSWFHEPLVAAFSAMNARNRDGLYEGKVHVHSFELWHGEDLVAGEVGCTSGACYTALSGFSKLSSAGSVQMAATGSFLASKGFTLWDLGMSLPYKEDMGAKSLPRAQFLSELRQCQTKTDVAFLELDRTNAADLIKPFVQQQQEQRLQERKQQLLELGAAAAVPASEAACELSMSAMVASILDGNDVDRRGLSKNQQKKLDKLVKEAAKLYEQCLAKDPAHFHALANLALLLMEHGGQRNGATAIALFERALAQDDSWFDGHYNVGNMYMELGPEGESKAIAHYEAALCLQASDADVCNNLAICLMRAGRLFDALEAAKKAVRFDKSSDTFRANLAGLYNECGDTKKAIFFARKCSPANVDAKALLASLLVQQGSFDEAQTTFEAILDQRHDAALVPRLRLFSLLMSCDKAAEARVVLARGLELLEQEDNADRRGHAMLSLFLSSRPSSLSVQREQELSGVCETVLLHMRLDDPTQLAHKCLVADHLAAAGTSDVAPETFVCDSAQQLIEVLQGEREQHMWYVKDPMLQRGQGISVLRPPFDLQAIKAKLPSGRRICLQRAVDPPCLIRGRKFGIRMHVFVAQRAADPDCLVVFVAQDGILTMCAKPYTSQDTSALAQITCTSVQRSQPGFDRKAVKGPASVFWADGFAKALPAMEEAVVATVSAVRGALAGTLSAPTESSGWLRGQLFGYDFVFAQDGTPRFIEANLSPQFQDAKHIDTLRAKVAIPLVNGLLEALTAHADQVDHGRQDAGWKCVTSLLPTDDRQTDPSS
ncbi:Leucyl/phenylalanyl-tRNA--protein transferase (L/F-transferase) (Leucyltransferase) (Phenyalanyltransferase) [Durusdinium trenchii]|uniref:Leucyl/phenylalanyl-tRNA--protein transferase (L/F-transferase) (Leucyltransferase) (Phenyalanyltransferase) n=1 Tax=Durusdinium trenchii TaxID=1381693 RepID=A0ABP0R6I0_9DINO